MRRRLTLASIKEAALSPLQRRAVELLRHAAAPSLLSPLDLLAIGLILKPDAYVEGRSVAATLVRHGYSGAADLPALAGQLDTAAKHFSALKAKGGGFDLANPHLLEASATVAVVRAESALAVGGNTPERRPPVRGDRIGSRPAPKPEPEPEREPKHGRHSDFFDEPGPQGWEYEPWDFDFVSTGDEVRELTSRHRAARDPADRRKPARQKRNGSLPRDRAQASAAARAPRERAQAGGAPRAAETRPQTSALKAPEPIAPPRAVVSPPDEVVLSLLVGGTKAGVASDNLDCVRLVLGALEIASAEKFHDLWSIGALTGVESHQYQIETVRRVLRSFRGRALLADEVGLGKTIEALMILREYQMRGMVRRALVLVPPALVHHWAGELTEKGGISVRTTLDAEARRDDGDFWDRLGVIVASLALARSGRHAERVAAVEWDLVVVDEAHHVKNRKTLGYQLVNRLKSRFLLLLTATPVETDLEELYNLVTLLKPGQFATPAAFRREYVDSKDPTSPRNREKLRSLLSEVMVRNTRADSGLALPPRFVTTVTVDPTEPERTLYEKVLELFRRHKHDRTAKMAASTLLLEAGSCPSAVAATAQRVVENARHSEAFRLDAEGLLSVARAVTEPRKDRAIAELLAAEGDQALVFTRFRDAAERLARTLDGAGLEVAQYHGALGAEEKHRVVERFRNGLGCVVATDVGGEGQNLQFCHLLVNYDLPWNPMVIEQRIGRLHRMGQTEPVKVYNFCTRGTVEERLLDVLDRRLHLFELVIGEIDMVLGNLADERDLEERILDLYAQATAEDDIANGFDAIADDLARARSRYEKTRALDAALFERDYES